MGIVLAVPDPEDWISPPPVAAADHIDTFGILAEAATALKCAADTIYDTRSIPEAMLDTTLARLAEAEKAVRAMKERTI